jgi:ribosomal protein S18 acetylase RimI-like enzyme
MKPTIEIRDLQPGDESRLVDIALAAWTPIYESYRKSLGEELYDLMHSDWQKRKAKQILSVCRPDEPGMVLAAYERVTVAGFVSFYPNAPKAGVAEIGNNAVHPDFQRQGIAKMMYREVFQRLRTLGIKYVKVRTGGDPSHMPARKAYEGVDFNIELPVVEYYRRL